jgi:cell division septation protein DedD
MAEKIDVNPGDRPPKSGAAPTTPWGRRVLTVMVALAALGGFAAVVVYSYGTGTPGDTGKRAPVITAQEGPVKVRPKDPGGMVVPNRDKRIYGRLNAAEEAAVAERLLPPPETAVSKPPKDDRAGDVAKMAEKEMEKTARRLSAIAPSSGKASRSVEIPPPPPAVASLPTKMVEKQPARTVPKKGAKMAATETRKMAKLAPKPAAKSGSPYRIQIASLRSQADAKKAWGRLTKKHKDLFGTLKSKIVRVDLKGKGTFYRLQAGPLGDQSSARAFCSKLKKRKIGCLVVKP